MNDLSDLKIYKCNQNIHAEPMTKEVFCSLFAKDRSCYDKHSDQSEGYHVVHCLGVLTEEHHLWFPKAVFEKSFTEIGKVQITKEEMEIAKDEAAETFDLFADPGESWEDYLDAHLCCYFGVDDVALLEVTND